MWELYLGDFMEWKQVVNKICVNGRWWNSLAVFRLLYRLIYVGPVLFHCFYCVSMEAVSTWKNKETVCTVLANAVYFVWSETARHSTNTNLVHWWSTYRTFLLSINKWMIFLSLQVWFQCQTFVFIVVEEAYEQALDASRRAEMGLISFPQPSPCLVL